MSTLSLLEKDDIYKFSLLSTKLVTILNRYEKTKELNEIEYETLKRGVDFLEKLTQGSLLINKKAEYNGLYPSSENLLTYEYAISIYDQLDIDLKNIDFSELFYRLRNNLKSIIENKNIKMKETNLTKSFFLYLSKVLLEETQKDLWDTPDLELSDLTSSSYGI